MAFNSSTGCCDGAPLFPSIHMRGCSSDPLAYELCFVVFSTWDTFLLEGVKQKCSGIIMACCCHPLFFSSSHFNCIYLFLLCSLHWLLLWDLCICAVQDTSQPSLLRSPIRSAPPSPPPSSGSLTSLHTCEHFAAIRGGTTKTWRNRRSCLPLVPQDCHHFAVCVGRAPYLLSCEGLVFTGQLVLNQILFVFFSSLSKLLQLLKQVLVFLFFLWILVLFDLISLL